MFGLLVRLRSDGIDGNTFKKPIKTNKIWRHWTNCNNQNKKWMKGKNNNLNQYIIMQLEALQSYANTKSFDGNAFLCPWMAEFRTRGIQPINAVKLQLAKWYNLYDFPLPSIGNNLTYTFGTQARIQLKKLKLFESREMDEEEKRMRLQAVLERWPTTDSNSSQPRNRQRGFGHAYSVTNYQLFDLFNGPISEVRALVAQIKERNFLEEELRALGVDQRITNIGHLRQLVDKVRSEQNAFMVSKKEFNLERIRQSELKSGLLSSSGLSLSFLPTDFGPDLTKDRNQNQNYERKEQSYILELVRKNLAIKPVALNYKAEIVREGLRILSDDGENHGTGTHRRIEGFEQFCQNAIDEKSSASTTTTNTKGETILFPPIEIIFLPAPYTQLLATLRHITIVYQTTKEKNCFCIFFIFFVYFFYIFLIV